MTYANAISMAHPHAYQVSDKFHLIKNLTERATLYFQQTFQGRIAIPMTDTTASQKEQLRNGTAKERILIVKKLHAEGRTMGEIRGMTNMSNPTIRKYLNWDEQQVAVGKTVRARSHEKAVLKVQQKADWVRKLYADGLSQHKIVQITGFTAVMVKRYLSPAFTPVNGHYGTSREGKLAPYRETVLKMRRDGMKYQQIAEYIRKLGYTGSVAALRGFVTKCFLSTTFP